MKLKCLQCKHEFDGSISSDELGWHSSCPKCGGSFDVDIPSGKIVMMFADDSNPERDCEQFTDEYQGQAIKAYYAFDSVDDFLKKWKAISEHPDGMWYWVLTDKRCICSGACDPDDIELFKDYFNNKTGGTE